MDRITIGAALGGAAVYFLDPQRGEDRRRRVQSFWRENRDTTFEVGDEVSQAAECLDPGRDKKVDVFRAMPEADPSMYERDQYEGYLQIPRVKPASATETYVVVEREQDCARRGEQLVSAANSLSCIGRDRVHSASAAPASTW
jgi:hypothetical protein